MATPYTALPRGSEYTPNYKVYLSGPNGPISPFHDIPLFGSDARADFHMIVEIPRWTNAKMEISKEQKLNPIVQDVKKGNLRYVDNVFPYRGYPWNYGAMPQTWEDPNHVDERTNAKGDNDPLDLCEIGSKVHSRGSVIRVKPLGLLGLIDEGETDWKLIVIDVTDPLAEKLNDIGDVESEMPGLLEATRRWFRVYKMPQGKPPNEFAFGGEFKDRQFAVGIIQETHLQWQSLMNQTTDAGGISCDNVAVLGSPYRVPPEAAAAVLQAAPEPAAPARVPQQVDKWHFVSA